jgi:hypothetical protein
VIRTNLRSAVAVVCIGSSCLPAAYPAGEPAQPARRLLARAAEAAPSQCIEHNCAVVLAIKRLEPTERFGPVPTQGAIRRQPPFGQYDPRTPPVAQSAFPVERVHEAWDVEVRHAEGNVQHLRQSGPVLLQPGDRVVVEAGGVRAWP